MTCRGGSARLALPAALGLTLATCTGPPSSAVTLTADTPLHLEDHLAQATIEGSELAAAGTEPVVWRFDEPQPEWRAHALIAPPNLRETTYADGGLRIMVAEVSLPTLEGRSVYGAGVYVDSPGLASVEPRHLLVRARTESAGVISVAFGGLEDGAPRDEEIGLFRPRSFSEPTPLVADGSVQSYLLPLYVEGRLPEACCRMGVSVMTYEPGTVDILSVTAVSRSTAFGSDPVGVMTVVDGSLENRRTIFTHAPGQLSYHIRVPPDGRLDVGLGVTREGEPVDFRVTVAPSAEAEVHVLEETLADPASWAQRSVDLSPYEGQTVTLTLRADAEAPGTVALWASPTVSGAGEPGRPNIVFYIIDGAAADFMSVYGYNRRTTPNLERLAAEGAVFEHAYSNATWTRTSTPSFMTSLHHSVLGGYLTGTDPLPDEAVTMAEHMHRGGYQTAVFTANPYAGTMSTLDRGVDLLRDSWDEFSYFGERSNHSSSSTYLHGAFWRWRGAYPGQPYWVHFQAVDIHWPWNPVAPFVGLFGSVDAAQRLEVWEDAMDADDSGLGWWELFEAVGTTQAEYIRVSQALYDETMAHNDYQIGRLVDDGAQRLPDRPTRGSPQGSRGVGQHDLRRRRRPQS